jgi:ribonuclease BN (tRNA processing enzyme)
VELTVLGASSRYLTPLGAGTSYLVRAGDTRLLLDCGNGTSLRLASELGDAKLSGVLVSHFHLDTVADLFPVAFSLPPRTPLVVPRGALPRISDLLRAYSMDRSWIEHARVLGVGPGRAVEWRRGGSSGPRRIARLRRRFVDGRGDEHVVGDLRLTFSKAAHGCPGVVTRIESGGRALVYLSDTGPRPWLADFARGADLVVAHTLLLDREESPAADHNMTAGAAGRLARDAGASALALSHVPFYRNADESVAEAAAAFGGKVRVLREGERLAV